MAVKETFARPTLFHPEHILCGTSLAPGKGLETGFTGQGQTTERGRWRQPWRTGRGLAFVSAQRGGLTHVMPVADNHNG